ncbi:unnamed protein product [Ambrosiozyma monospora]|uniref:Unnamed protein product n=1 Tax=Ambrosiozyma monospora TaxID=43982 RepID=A0A9W7DD91_AMBMO|nr:unnamed protein product [Ambrosiozyma monospora]
MGIQVTPSSFKIAFVYLGCIDEWEARSRTSITVGDLEFRIVQVHCKEKQDGADDRLSMISNLDLTSIS